MHFVAGERLRQLSRACSADAIATEVDLLQDVVLSEAPCQLGCACLVTCFCHWDLGVCTIWTGHVFLSKECLHLYWLA